MSDRLQYISQGFTAEDQAYNIRKALDHGASWIQVRWKNADHAAVSQLAEKVRKWCSDQQALCIINDHVGIVRDIDADGVHLGLDDDSVEAARQALGKDKIIGGTANTFEDVMQRAREACDYIGLGPYRFTTTKDSLSPVLGSEGYRAIMSRMKMAGVQLPVYAIGGIELSDIEEIMSAGVYGVALSGLITRNPSVIKNIKKLLL